MSQAEIANIINKLVDMLLEEGKDKDEILDELDLSDYGFAFCELEWMRR